MSKLSKEEAEKEYAQRLQEFEEASKKYFDYLKQCEPSSLIKPTNMRELEKVSDELKKAEEEFEKSKQTLFDSYNSKQP